MAFLLKEDGDKLLQENNDRILLEQILIDFSDGLLENVTATEDVKIDVLLLVTPGEARGLKIFDF